MNLGFRTLKCSQDCFIFLIFGVLRLIDLPHLTWQRLWFLLRLSFGPVRWDYLPSNSRNLGIAAPPFHLSQSFLVFGRPRSKQHSSSVKPNLRTMRQETASWRNRQCSNTACKHSTSQSGFRWNQPTTKRVGIEQKQWLWHVVTKISCSIIS